MTPPSPTPNLPDTALVGEPAPLSVTAKRKLTSLQFEILTFIEQEYYLNGGIPSADACESRNVCEPVFYRKCFADPMFRDALVARGIRLPLADGPIGVLSEEQLIVANAVLDTTDNRSRKKKLTELNCPTQKWEAWLRDPVFQQYLRHRSENLLGDNTHEAHLALVDRVRTGDVAAIKYYNEITGRYVPNAKGGLDVSEVLVRVLEVIQRHVRDPEALRGIADELLGLAASSTPNGPSIPTQRPVLILESAPVEPGGSTSGGLTLNL